MAYEQAAHYGGAPARGYYDQQVPRGAPRNASRPGPGPRGPPPQQYLDEYSGYGREGAHFQGQEQEYHGYDRESFWGAYGGDTSGYPQNYEQDYGHQQQYDQGYNNAPQQRRGPPGGGPPRGPMPRGDGYGPPRARGYSNGMNGQMGPGPGSRGRGPPQGYPPRGGMQQYDDRRHMGGSQGGPSPPRQKRESFQYYHRTFIISGYLVWSNIEENLACILFRLKINIAPILVIAFENHQSCGDGDVENKLWTRLTWLIPTVRNDEATVL